MVVYRFLLFFSIHFYTLSDMFNAIFTHFFRQGLDLQLIFLAWPQLPPTSTGRRRIIGNYSVLFYSWYRTVFDIGLLQPGVEPTTSNHHSSSHPVAGLQACTTKPDSHKIIHCLSYEFFNLFHKKFSLYNFYLLKKRVQTNGYIEKNSEFKKKNSNAFLVSLAIVLQPDCCFILMHY